MATSIKKFVLDTTTFVTAAAMPHGQLLYPTQVSDELRSKAAALKAELSKAKPVFVKKEFLAKAETARKKTGDSISQTDLAVVALALQEQATVVSDDYGVQNLAQSLSLPILAIAKRGIAEQWSYEYKCRGCGKIYLKTGVCGDCGGKIKRKRI